MWHRLREASICLEEGGEVGGEVGGKVEGGGEAGASPQRDVCECIGSAEVDVVAAEEEIAVVRESVADMQATLKLARSDWCFTMSRKAVLATLLKAARRNSRVSLEVRIVAVHWTVRGVLGMLASVAAAVGVWRLLRARGGTRDPPKAAAKRE